MPDSLNFVAEQEPWTTYTLEDGTRLRVRVVLTKVLRDGNHEDGSPKYQLGFQQIVDVTPGELVDKVIPRKEVS